MSESSHLWRRCFPVNFAKFLRTSFLQNTSGRLASVHIHVERAIQRVKNFRVLRNEISLSLHGSVNQIWTVCWMLCNFMTPLFQKDMESGGFILNNVWPYTELVSLINHFFISEKSYLAENTVFLKSSPLSRQKITVRSSHPEMSVKISLLKIPLNLHEDTPDCRSATLLKETPALAFSCKFCEILRNI